jgi:hypothetical protein
VVACQLDSQDWRLPARRLGAHSHRQQIQPRFVAPCQWWLAPPRLFFFGGKLTLSTIKEYHASQDPSEDNKVMHALLEADNGITFMAFDTPNRLE